LKSFNSILKSRIQERKSWLCVGLDISPESLGSDNLDDLKSHTFRVIDSTRDYAVAYKPNFAFFERWGAKGFSWLEETVEYIGHNHIKIADAKRGDIGNTARQYAHSIFEHFGFDCVTINPYMGSDSVDPFLENKGKGVFLLAKTSNASAMTIQDVKEKGITIYERVAHMAKDLNHNNNVGLVVGATVPKDLKIIRSIVPVMPILIPGVGAQGGDLNTCMKIGNNDGISLINISRSISFTSDMSTKSIKNASSSFLAQMQDALK
tara:strand:- start:531 stop:1322 length:792 start_codon:yes stop_codon:yes gene_type:complete